jgi:hypothetical protein
MNPPNIHLRRRARRRPIRRYAATLAVVTAITGAGVSGVAHARTADVEELAEEVTVPVTTGSWGLPASFIQDLAAGWGARLATFAAPELAVGIEEEGEPVPTAEEIEHLEAIFTLMTPYEWGERSFRVGALQELLGVTVDGWYGRQTLRAHEGALEWAGLSTDHLPEAPPPPPRPAPGTRSGGPSAGQWAALRQCESSGNYRATNPSGRYRGAYQFDQSTWNSVASRRAPHLVGVDPAAASPGDQDAMARALYASRGAQPWPVCGRHLR